MREAFDQPPAWAKAMEARLSAQLDAVVDSFTHALLTLDEKLCKHVETQCEITRANSATLARRVTEVVDHALDSNERIRALDHTLKSVAAQLDALKFSQDRASGNGTVE
jgi:hypothetical protein